MQFADFEDGWEVGYRRIVCAKDEGATESDEPSGKGCGH